MNRQQHKKLKSKRALSAIQLDPFLLILFFALVSIGIIMVGSASMVVAEANYNTPYYFVIRQSIFLCIGIVAMVCTLSTPTSIWKKMNMTWLVLGFILLVLVLIPGIGHKVNGSSRWIRLGPINLQVSELVKLCGIMYLANYLVRRADEIKSGLLGIAKPMFVLCMMAFLLLLEPDFGACTVLFIAALGMCFMAGAQLRWFILMLAIGACAVAALVVFSPYRLARLTGFLNPWVNQFGSGYQLTQSLIAFGRGGIFGLGLGDGIQKLFYLPEAHTDFIFAVISEELGLMGGLTILGLYGTLVWRGIYIARKAQKLSLAFAAYVAYGISFWLGFQVIVNIGVSSGMLPTKGLTLPFISYGGSSLIVDAMAFGILLRIDLENKHYMAKHLTSYFTSKMSLSKA